MSEKDGVVHLWDLPEDKVCVKLPKDIQRLMVEKALEIVGGRYNLAHMVGVKPVNIYDFEKCRFQSTTLSVVKKLSNFLVKNKMYEFSLENLETKVELIKAKFVGGVITKPQFPINFKNEDGAQIISAILHDGGIVHDNRPFYSNNEEILVDTFIANIQKIIGQIEYNKRKDGKNFKVEFPTILGLILVYGIEMASGRKVFTNPSIPEFIIKNPKLHKSFLQQAFDDEGHISIGPSGRSITITQYHTFYDPPLRLLQLKELIELNNIFVNGPYPTKDHNAKEGYMSFGWVIQISNQQNIRAFAEKINFTLERKRKKLEKLLNSYKLPPRFRNGTKYKEVLRVCKELKAENEKITIKNIANKLNRKPKYVAELTLDMTKRKMLKVVKEKVAKKGFGSGFSEKEFELV